MALPVVISAGSAALMAVAPQVAVPVVAAYAANCAIRGAFRAAEYQVQQAEVSQLQAIASKLEIISQRIYDSDNNVNLAEAVQRKGAMPDELHIHVNTDPDEYSSGERWTVDA